MSVAVSRAVMCLLPALVCSITQEEALEQLEQVKAAQLAEFLKGAAELTGLAESKFTALSDDEIKQLMSLANKAGACDDQCRAGNGADLGAPLDTLWPEYASLLTGRSVEAEDMCPKGKPTCLAFIPMAAGDPSKDQMGSCVPEPGAGAECEKSTMFEYPCRESKMATVATYEGNFSVEQCWDKCVETIHEGYLGDCTAFTVRTQGLYGNGTEKSCTVMSHPKGACDRFPGPDLRQDGGPLEVDGTTTYATVDCKKTTTTTTTGDGVVETPSVDEATQAALDALAEKLEEARQEFLAGAASLLADDSVKSLSTAKTKELLSMARNAGACDPECRADYGSSQGTQLSDLYPSFANVLSGRFVDTETDNCPKDLPQCLGFVPGATEADDAWGSCVPEPGACANCTKSAERGFACREGKMKKVTKYYDVDSDDACWQKCVSTIHNGYLGDCTSYTFRTKGFYGNTSEVSCTIMSDSKGKCDSLPHAEIVEDPGSDSVNIPGTTTWMTVDCKVPKNETTGQALPCEDDSGEDSMHSTSSAWLATGSFVFFLQFVHAV